MRFKEFLFDEDGIGTVEMVLILVIILAIVIIFRGKIMEIVNNALDKVSSDSETIIGK